MQPSSTLSQMTMRPFEITFGKSRYHLINEMIEWCTKEFGPGGYLPPADGAWIVNGAFGNNTFAFANKKHYTWFVLRWQ